MIIHTKRIVAAIVIAVIQTMLIILKIAHIVNWSWLVIFIPLWLPYAVIMISVTAVILYVSLTSGDEENNGNKLS